jgi:hypothetical protein
MNYSIIVSQRSQTAVHVIETHEQFQATLSHEN